MRVSWFMVWCIVVLALAFTIYQFPGIGLLWGYGGKALTFVTPISFLGIARLASEELPDLSDLDDDPELTPVRLREFLRELEGVGE